MSASNNKGLKDVSADDGFEIFGCQIPHSVVGFCKKFLKRYPKWTTSIRDVIIEKNHEYARLISRDVGENLANLNGFTGLQLATTLENVMQESFKGGDITFDDVFSQKSLLDELKNVVSTKPKKKSPKPQQLNTSSTSTPRKRSRSVVSEDSDNDGDDDQACEEPEETDQESEVENDADENMTANESSVSLSRFPTTPSYTKPTKKQRRSIKPALEKKASTSEESDSDSFDPIVDEDLTVYNPTGEIQVDTKRLVIKGANKNYYGL